VTLTLPQCLVKAEVEDEPVHNLVQIITMTDGETGEVTLTLPPVKKGTPVHQAPPFPPLDSFKKGPLGLRAIKIVLYSNQRVARRSAQKYHACRQNATYGGGAPPKLLRISSEAPPPLLHLSGWRGGVLRSTTPADKMQHMAEELRRNSSASPPRLLRHSSTSAGGAEECSEVPRLLRQNATYGGEVGSTRLLWISRPMWGGNTHAARIHTRVFK